MQRQDWRIKWTHNQTINPSSRFDANLEFVSGSNYITQNIKNYNELLRQEIISNATYFKSWEESGNSISLNYSRRQELQNGNITEFLPKLNFNHSQSYPFRRKGSGADQKWYELFGYSYSGQFQNRRIKEAGNLQVRGGIQHNFSSSFSPKIGYFSFTPNFSYTEKWYNKHINQYAIYNPSKSADSIVTEDVKAINFVRTFRFGVSSQTKFYGIINPNILGIAAIRHTVNPSVSYSYQPDFSKPQWGYYGAYRTSTGKIVRYDKYQKEVYGGAGAGEQQNLSFNVSNIFEMKTTVDPTDTTSKEKKIQLLNLSAGINYNFAADSLKFSDINLSYRTQIGELFSFSGSSTFSLYDYYETGQKSIQRINKFLINEGKGLLRLTNFNFSISTSLSGERLKSRNGEKVDTTLKSTYELGQTQDNVYKGIYDAKETDFSIPWDVSLSYNYNMSKPTPLQYLVRSNLNASLNFNLTPNWKLALGGSYDFQSKEFAAPQIRISRDLHAWIMNFTWNPLGSYRGYYLEVRVKAPQLQDLKLTKRDQFFSGK